MNATTGAVTATQVYAPYGAVRYASGSLPGSHGFTGQHSDAATSGLDYYGARYYDPVAGQFTSADSVLPKQGASPDPSQLNRYAYVAGNPESRTDPTGHYLAQSSGGGENRLHPDPKRDGHTVDFYRDYWTDSLAGKGGYNDWFYNLVMSSRRRTAQERANAAHEDADGTVLATYFGLTIRHIPVELGPTGPVTTPDYMVEIDTGLAVSPLGEGAVADRAQPKYSTAIDLYTPTSTRWSTIITGGYDKGAQASIVAIDISKVDPSGRISTQELMQYAAQIVYWSPTKTRSDPSRVVRVIFIRNGEVVHDQNGYTDYNPTSFGPPSPDNRPTHYLT